MKKFVYIPFCLCVLLLTLTSCQDRNVRLTNMSPNGEVEVIVEAEQPVMFDPWRVTLKTEGYGHDEQLAFELYNNSLDNESVDFNWEDDDQCTITFEQSNGQEIVFKLNITDTRFHLRKVY